MASNSPTRGVGHMLTDMTVRQAKATGKPYTIADFDGPPLRRRQRRQDSGTFATPGSAGASASPWGYPELSLREARELRDEARSLVARGINPAPSASRSARPSNSPARTPSWRSRKVDGAPAAHPRRGPAEFAGADSPRLQKDVFPT